MNFYSEREDDLSWLEIFVLAAAILFVLIFEKIKNFKNSVMRIFQASFFKRGT